MAVLSFGRRKKKDGASTSSARTEEKVMQTQEARRASVPQCQPFIARHVMVGASELALDHRRALEIMSDGQFLRDAEAAMGLERILDDEPGAARNLGRGTRSRNQPTISGQVRFTRAHA